jgi:D-glycero-D-manno-heptose 1,7-bisphosphate phosphatase
VLFLDRDGVIIQERHYLSDPELVTLIPGSAEAMRKARNQGYRLVGISNQSGLGRGRFTTAEFMAVQERLDQLLTRAGAGLDAFFFCPHAPEANCSCRKPATGLLVEAADVLPWRPEDSWLVGDKLSDVELALNAGLRAVLVRSGYGAEQEKKLSERASVHVADDLLAAVNAILTGGWA